MNGIAAMDRASRDAGAGRSGIRTRAHRRCPTVRHRLLRGGARLLARLALPRVRAPGPERVGDDLDGRGSSGRAACSRPRAASALRSPTWPRCAASARPRPSRACSAATTAAPRPTPARAARA